MARFLVQDLPRAEKRRYMAPQAVTGLSLGPDRHPVGKDQLVLAPKVLSLPVEDADAGRQDRGRLREDRRALSVVD